VVPKPKDLTIYPSLRRCDVDSVVRVIGKEAYDFVECLPRGPRYQPIAYQ
jgi:hypothetical protein